MRTSVISRKQRLSIRRSRTLNAVCTTSGSCAQTTDVRTAWPHSLQSSWVHTSEQSCAAHLMMGSSLRRYEMTRGPWRKDTNRCHSRKRAPAPWRRASRCSLDRSCVGTHTWLRRQLARTARAHVTIGSHSTWAPPPAASEAERKRQASWKRLSFGGASHPLHASRVRLPQTRHGVPKRGRRCT